MGRQRTTNTQFLVCCALYIVIAAGMTHLQSCRAGRVLSTFKQNPSSELPSQVPGTISNGSRTQYNNNNKNMVNGPTGWYRSMKVLDGNISRRMVISECAAAASGNLIDECWRCNPQWLQNRQALAKCAVGAGRDAVGGGNGRIYVVTDTSDADASDPAPGTLRYAVIQQEPLWIIFSRDMTIQLQQELIMNSFKTIDGRGFEVHIAGGAGVTLQSISNAIIHGVHIHDTRPTGPATIRSSPTHAGHRGTTDGDAVNIYASHHIWVDHCYFSSGADGLVDATMGSTSITISNNFFTLHDKVILLGPHPLDTVDSTMRVTVAYNHFGPGLIERLPRIRHGFVHVVNNMYEGWGMYAIGGSEAPTIVSQGNVFRAPNGVNKEVSKRLQDGGGTSVDGDERSWNWQSSDDMFLNGAFFMASGAPLGSQVYSTAIHDVTASPATMVATITANAGSLSSCAASAGGFC